MTAVLNSSSSVLKFFSGNNFHFRQRLHWIPCQATDVLFVDLVKAYSFIFPRYLFWFLSEKLQFLFVSVHEIFFLFVLLILFQTTSVSYFLLNNCWLFIFHQTIADFYFYEKPVFYLYPDRSTFIPSEITVVILLLSRK